MSDDRIGLVDAIHALRQELRDAQDGAPPDLQFTVEDIEVAFEVVTEKNAEASVGGSGKVRFWLFDADLKTEGKAGTSQTKTHTVKLKLTPGDYRIPGKVRDVKVSDTVPTPKE